MTDPMLTIQEVAERTGLTAHTLRYYERIGLIQPIDRASSGHRRYSESDMGWIEFLKKMRITGMPIREMKLYASLMWQGEQTSGARRRLLERHRERMQSKLQELNDCLSCIEWKIAHYKEFEMMAPVEAEEELVSDQSVVA
jgi:DNA-binding transcriptional MerR regulator